MADESENAGTVPLDNANPESGAAAPADPPAVTGPVEQLNAAGTAPAAPTQPSVAEAHATYEERLAHAKAVEAAMWDKVAAGATQADAKAQAIAENKAMTPPQNKNG